MSTKLVNKVLKNTRKIECGSYCMFVPLSEKRGVKFYLRQKERNDAYDMQRYANFHDLAPKAFGKFNTKNKKLISLYSDKCDRCLYEEDMKCLYGYVTEIANDVGMLSYKYERILYEKLKHIGLEHLDVERYNIGKIGHRVVCIDFDNDNCSFSKDNVKC